jgi:outer membrane immunogenic protein
MKKFLLAVAVWALATPAGAADILPFYRAPPFGPVATWTGFYVGVNAGWTGSWTDRAANSGTDTGGAGFGTAVSAGAIPGQATLHDNGFVGGGQIGFDWQFDATWVAGIEADFDGMSSKSSVAIPSVAIPVPGGAIIPPITTTYSRELDSVGTVRARLGYLSSATLLWYATGGLAYGETKFGTGAACQLWVPPCGPTTVSSSSMAFGWTFGGGVEWQFAPAWTLRAEYLYIDLGTATNTLTYNYGTNTSTFTSRLDESDSIVRVGVNYRFF